jgi:hypothetical protein
MLQKMKREYRIFKFILFLTVFQFPAASHSQELTEIDIEWMYSGDALGLASTPEYHWLPNEDFILFENTGKILPSIPMVYQYKSKKKSAMIDEERAVSSLMKMPVSEDLDMIPEHIAVNDQGTYLLYDINDDLFLLDLGASNFIQVTNSPAQEDSPLFSPDGTKLAFSMNNNLYFYDINTRKLSQLTNDGDYDILNGTLSWVYWE